MSPGEFFGLFFNIPFVQALRVLEGAASVALLITPSKAKFYLKEIGIETTETETETETIFDIHKLMSARRGL